MQEIIFGLASFLIATFAFGFGAVKLFKKKKPLYLQLIICAVECFALQQLSLVVNIWCNVPEGFSIGMFGIFGCNFFLLSANFGTLDKIVDDGRESDKARKTAIIAPVVLALLTVAVVLSWKEKDMLGAVMWVLMLLPALPASYYNLKHLLLPTDPFRFLKATESCNIAALAFYIATDAYVICMGLFGYSVAEIISLLMSFSALSLAVCAVKGAERWGI